MNSRERMLSAISGQKPDYVPLSFMIFNVLHQRTCGWQDAIRTGQAMGLDMCVNLFGHMPGHSSETSDIPGPAFHFAPGVECREWREAAGKDQYPTLHRQYITPDGTLETSLRQTDDWYMGDHVPFLNDYIEPRATHFPVSKPEDLKALQHLLCPPTSADIAECRAAWKAPCRFARDNGLLLTTGWGVAVDALAWLFGLTNAVMTAIDDPEFLQATLDVIGDWNRARMEVMLEAKPDLFVRRGWYEGTSFWSPQLYRQFLLPRLKDEVKFAHQAGAKFGYIMTVGSLQFADILLESGVDVVIGVEDIQDHGMNFRELKKKFAGRIGIWGGVSGFVTVEDGPDKGIRAATDKAMQQLGPEGFILSPVDNIRTSGAEVWRKTNLFIEHYRKLVGR